MGENMLLDRFIVMDNISSLADKSEDFANFLTVSRKFGFTCIYIFQAIYPTRNNWQMILSQTKMFNIFPGSIQASSVVKILLLLLQQVHLGIHTAKRPLAQQAVL